MLYLLFRRSSPFVKFTWLLEDLFIYSETLPFRRICCAAAGMSFGHHTVVVMLRKFGSLASLSPEINLLFGRLLALLEF